jgi:hypothetical protein
MLLIKAPRKPGQVWHQDESHIPTRDRSLTAVWLALDDATVDNGCLWVVPGSHRSGVLYPTRDRTDARFDTPEAHGFPTVPTRLCRSSSWRARRWSSTTICCTACSRTAARGRGALVNHYMSAESLLPWFSPHDGEPMGTLDHRDVLLVAGEDPYGAKGTVDVMRPRLRPEPSGAPPARSRA